jgi:hypothetical protein
VGGGSGAVRFHAALRQATADPPVTALVLRPDNFSDGQRIHMLPHGAALSTARRKRHARTRLQHASAGTVFSAVAARVRPGAVRARRPHPWVGIARGQGAVDRGIVADRVWRVVDTSHDTRGRARCTAAYGGRVHVWL